MSRDITISIVNHSHCDMVCKLLGQLSYRCKDVETVIISNNLQPKIQFDQVEYSFKLIILNNVAPLGFAQNHNKAFKSCETEYFCVIILILKLVKTIRYLYLVCNTLILKWLLQRFAH